MIDGSSIANVLFEKVPEIKEDDPEFAPAIALAIEAQRAAFEKVLDDRTHERRGGTSAP